MESPWSNFPFLQQNGGVGDQRGELIISRSGPGYSETKRYNLNDGQLIEIDEETRMDNDGRKYISYVMHSMLLTIKFSIILHYTRQFCANEAQGP